MSELKLSETQVGALRLMALAGGASFGAGSQITATTAKSLEKLGLVTIRTTGKRGRGTATDAGRAYLAARATLPAHLW